jgi:hypothetical protein
VCNAFGECHAVCKLKKNFSTFWERISPVLLLQKAKFHVQTVHFFSKLQLKWNRWLTGHQSTKMKLKYVETNSTKLSGNVKLQWKGLWLLTIYFDLGKPNAKSFQVASQRSMSDFPVTPLNFAICILQANLIRNISLKCNWFKLNIDWTLFALADSFSKCTKGFFNLQTAWNTPNAVHTIIQGQVFCNMT